jgi:large subunit ribosomal protein L13
MQRQTTFANPKTLKRKWIIIDAQGQVVGRLATKIATILMGKHRPEYTPYIDTGDFIVVVNAKGLRMTGNKAAQKFEKTFSGYADGLKQTSYQTLLEKKPARLLELAVKRMLPKNPHMGAAMFKKLHVYAGAEHPHQAQQPEKLAV